MREEGSEHLQLIIMIVELHEVNCQIFRFNPKPFRLGRGCIPVLAILSVVYVRVYHLRCEEMNAIQLSVTCQRERRDFINEISPC